MYPEIYANRPTAAVLSHVLGPKPELRYIRTNTLIGNTVNRQRVHKDVKGVHLSHPYAVAMNTCLVDTESSNGSTEVWLGTHNSSPWDDHVQHDVGWVRDDKLEERRAVRPPMQPSLSKGSVVLRDLRLWYVDKERSLYQARWHAQ
jgi:ectoine hydroxylase-related dioxygenase (phytanoyl-CoA dioxygenase family)